MGRKNAARRKNSQFKKNAQGDEGNIPQEKMPPSAEPVTQEIPPSDNSVTNRQGKSPKTHMGEASVNSSSEHASASQTSPERAENKNSCHDRAELLDTFQDSNSDIAAPLECVVGVGADMEDDSSVYKVERKTETPESKRRSLKVSRSEVKLFTKNVHLNSKQNPAGDTEELRAGLKNDQDEAKDKPQTEIDTRLLKLKKIDEEPKPAVGRIADRISLFEHPAAGVNKRIFQSPRSADVSPVRKATTMLQTDLKSLEKRSRSAERSGAARSRPESPGGKKPMTIKERMRNFSKESETGDEPTRPQNGTKTPVDKDPVILPEKDKKANSSKDSRETSASSPSPVLERPIEKPGLLEQEPPVEQTKIEVSGGITKPAPRAQCEESEITGSRSDKEIAQSPSDGATSNSTVDVAKKTAEKTFQSLMNKLSPVANGDIAPQLHTVKKEPVNNKPSQTTKAPTSPDTTPLSTMKKLRFPHGRSKDDSATPQDAPSSWLDVDFPKRRLKVSMPKLSSSGSESNLLDTSGELDDNDFIEKIQKLCAPFSLPPRKHNQIRPPQPPFAMPAIREARFEKTFDPDEFKFGLSKKNQFSVDTSSSLLASKYQNKETKTGMMPARASLADRSMLLSILDPHSRLRDNSPVREDVKEEKDDQIKVKSRLEGSCVLSSLNSSLFRGRRKGVQTQVEGTHSGDVSPTEAPQLSPLSLTQTPPRSPTAAAPLQDTQALSNREKAQCAEAVSSDSGLPLPVFNDIKLPDYLEKYLPRGPAKPERSVQGPEQVRTEVIGKMKAPACETDMAMKPGRVLPDAVPPCAPKSPPITHPILLEHKKPPAIDYSLPHIDLFTEPEGHGRVTPYHNDSIETGSFGVPLSTASIQVHSGVWLVFSDPGFQGMAAVLETGEYPVPDTWGFTSPFVGSLRPLKMGGFKVENPNEVKALLYEKPGLEGSCWDVDGDIFSFDESEGDMATDGENLDSRKLKSVGSLRIIGGLWVGYSEPGFEGQQYIMEEGEYLECSDWGGSDQLGSLRPILSDFISPHLKMFSDKDFGELGVNIDLTVPVIDMDGTGYGVRTQSIDVISGV
ncbi:Absent in melanoma 1 protein [Liparis tanakae]|uniref:Absent in melanoma 1 protein n=1 Tax=Liparis tanakae TaxID=230148 RepID=A0A4Z2G6Z0_9TELE|nr:Absent in melanoma 1 protein [Liparis tanakae]